MTSDSRAAAFAELRRAVGAELAEPLPAAIHEFAASIAARGGHGSTAAVLFYGSNLRSGVLDGVLDFYVLADALTPWYGRRLIAAANRVLPPNILYFERDFEGQRLRAKVAVLRVDQFLRAMRADGLDTTMWARYAQPAALAYGRDEAARDAVVEAVSRAVVSASVWAARLGPARGAARDFWNALFGRTYQAELRVERSGARSRELTAHAEARYAQLLPLAWRAAGLSFELRSGELTPRVGAAERQRARSGWNLRHALGKPLNFVRLIKSAYTFEGGVDYVLWKIERHSGVRVELTPWQHRHPILASPLVFWKLRRSGVVR